jgi:hypothetical protein
MNKEIGSFVLKWVGFTTLIFAVHYYILATLFTDLAMYFPLWSIYLFNAGLVLLVFLIINYMVNQGYTKSYTLFLILTFVKMALAIIFLLPLFAGKAAHAVVDIINFFIPYFFFLGFEIFQLAKFFKKQETK